MDSRLRGNEACRKKAEHRTAQKTPVRSRARQKPDFAFFVFFVFFVVQSFDLRPNELRLGKTETTNDQQSIRRDRRRRRPQRPRLRGLPGAGRAQGARPRAPPRRSAARRSTEEIFPGFTFSVCSYVVSLLRPEIIRDLDLPRHGLRDPAARGHVHALSGRRLPRRAGRSASARAARSAAIRRATPRPTTSSARRWPSWPPRSSRSSTIGRPTRRRCSPRELLRPAPARQAVPRARATSGCYRTLKMMTMSAVDFLDEWFESDALKAPMSVERHHRHVPRRALAGHRVRAAAPLHGRDRRRLPRLGLRQGRHRRDREGDRGGGARARRRDPHRRAGRSSVHRARTAGPPAWCSRTATRFARDAVVSAVDPQRTFLQLVGEEHLPDEFARPDPRASRCAARSGKVNLALDGLPDFTCLPGRRPAPARRRSRSPEHRLPRARLRRGQVRRVLAKARTWTSSSRR